MAPSTGFYTIIMIMMATVLTRSAAVITSRDNCSGETMTLRTEVWSIFLPSFASGVLVLALPEVSYALTRNSDLGQISAVGIPLSAIALYILISTLHKKVEQAHVVVKMAAKSDPLWDRSFLIDCAREAFFRFQKFVSDQHREELQLYMTEKLITLLKSNRDKSFNLWQLSRRGDREFELKDIEIIEAFDSTDRNKDRFCALMSGLLVERERSLDSKKVQPKNSKHTEFVQLWHFRRSNDTWLLDMIETRISLRTALCFRSGSDLN